MPIAKRFLTIEPAAPDAVEEWHIAGIAVHCVPARLESVCEAIAAMTGAEIHGTNPQGKLVVTLEAPTSRAIAAQLELLQHLDGVLSAALVYQHGEEASAMAQEIDHDLHPQGLH